MQLLKAPVLSYIRELNKITREDPQYLAFHSRSVTLHVRRLLAEQHGYVDDSEKEMIARIKEAIVRLRSFEK